MSGNLISFSRGMLIWYVDLSYVDNWVGNHPGEGFLGIVDADQHTNTWNVGTFASTPFQIHDAAFSLEKTDKMFVDYSEFYGYKFVLYDRYTKANVLFDDSKDYTNPNTPDSGRNIPTYGLKIRIIGESKDSSVGKILIFK